MIKVSNLGVKRDHWIVRNLDFEFHYNKVYGVIGNSGEGKTTFLKLLSGLIDSDEGEVVFDESRVVGPSVKLIPGYDEIQLVNQDFALEPYHTVEQNIKEKILSRKENVQNELIDEFLQLVELEDIRNRKAHLLSGGEQQRLSIARALACEPKVLLLDEPFVHLDQRLKRKILDYLYLLAEERELLIILVSHDGSEMMGFVDTILHLEKGSIKRVSPANDMYYHPDSIEQGALMGEINEVEWEGSKLLFRPSSYTLEEPNMKITFKKSVDLGLMVLNHFLTENKEVIILSSREEMSAITKVRIT